MHDSLEIYKKLNSLRSLVEELLSMRRYLDHFHLNTQDEIR